MLIDEIGNDDVLLKLDLNRNAVKILSKENVQKQYGYIFLDNLSPRYNYINFDYTICQHICESLVKILCGYNDHSARALLRPLEGVDNSEEGIYLSHLASSVHLLICAMSSSKSPILFSFKIPCLGTQDQPC